MNKHLSYLSLIFVSILCGTFWRIEIELHGWKGLIWLSYFHLAIPIGFALFLIWGNIQFHLSLKRRLQINFLAIIYGVLITFLLSSSSYVSYPVELIVVEGIPHWLKRIYKVSFLLLIPLIPAGVYLVLKLFNIQPNLKGLLLAIIGFVISFPASILILKMVNHIGSHDMIHAIKSGVLIPFWVFSIGILLINRNSKIALKG